jgi:hypothetical protein
VERRALTVATSKAQDSGHHMSTVRPEVAALGKAAPPAHRRLLITAVILLVAMAVLALLVCGFRRESRAIPSPLIGKPAPPFTLPLFDGTMLRLEICATRSCS